MLIFKWLADPLYARENALKLQIKSKRLLSMSCKGIHNYAVAVYSPLFVYKALFVFLCRFDRERSSDETLFFDCFCSIASKIEVIIVKAVQRLSGSFRVFPNK